MLSYTASDICDIRIQEAHTNVSGEKKRLQFVDAMKCLAVIVIAVLHALPSPLIRENLAMLKVSMVGLFFFISGYCCRPEKCRIKTYIGTRAKGLLKPFFRYSLSLWTIGTIYLLIAKRETIVDALCCLRNFYIGCIWNRAIQNLFAFDYHSLGKLYPFLAGFWFLITMFLASVLLALLTRFVFRKRAICLCSAAVLMLLGGFLADWRNYLPYNLHTALYYCGIMMLGTFAGQTGFPQKSILPWWLQWASGAICIIVPLVLKPWIPDFIGNMFRGDFCEPQLLGMAYVTVSTLMMAYGFFRLFYCLERVGFRMKEMCFWGRNSIDMYLLHVFVYWIISISTGYPIGGKEQPADIHGIVRSLLAVVAAIVVCTVFMLIKKRFNSARG